ncbi:hypothetical protein CMK13_18820 [Candidatus Poribacteria bacterium]|jgi:hypothetical protein|nr:hypothetical protein [Candidatus Poribacteria bacterium]
MKKLLLSIAMLFSIAMYSHDLSDKLRGAWSSEKTSYYVVILHDENKGYELVNFSFAENQTLKETVVEEGKNYIKTKVYNPTNDFETFVTYTFINGELHCEFEGKSNHVTIYKKYWLMTN